MWLSIGFSTATIDNIGSRMDWKRDHVRALNQCRLGRKSSLRRELQLLRRGLTVLTYSLACEPIAARNSPALHFRWM